MVKMQLLAKLEFEIGMLVLNPCPNNCALLPLDVTRVGSTVRTRVL